MSAFTVELDNHPGELARLCEALASGGVNLLLCATTQGSSGIAAFIADDEAAAQAVLDRAGTEYLLRPALTVRMANLPGAGAAAFRKLAEAGINVELLLPARISDEEFFAVICLTTRPRLRGRWAARSSPGKALGSPPRRGWWDVLL
jgi:hypothetical protein